jgi:DNA repair exonuclease SbcCD ATPase subunit
MNVIYCANCGIPFGVTDDKQQRLRDTGDSFYCPNGHSNVYNKSTISKLREDVQREKSAREQAEAHSREWRNKFDLERKEKNRLHKRIHGGVCPCCNRHFVNVERHMKSKHGGETKLSAKGKGSSRKQSANSGSTK